MAAAAIPLSQILKQAEARLAAAGVESPGANAGWLAEHAFKIRRGEQRLRGDRVITDAAALAVFEGLVARRVNREPLQRILGSWEFWGLELQLSPDTLIPRADTETLVEAVLARRPDRTRPWRILDLGTGTGAILLALLSEYGAATGLGVDVAPGAVETASANAGSLGLATRARFAQGDWAAGLAGPFDIIASNPPYIAATEIDTLEPEVAAHEPRRALDGGADGLLPYPAIIQAASRILVPGGLLALEHGWTQGQSVAEMLRQAGFAGVETVPDPAGHDRVAIAVRG